MSKGPRHEAEEYLERHNIRGLFKVVTISHIEGSTFRALALSQSHAWGKCLTKSILGVTLLELRCTDFNGFVSQHISTRLLFAKPEDPKAFLVQVRSNRLISTFEKQ
jgi:hypothetical protein